MLLVTPNLPVLALLCTQPYEVSVTRPAARAGGVECCQLVFTKGSRLLMRIPQEGIFRYLPACSPYTTALRSLASSHRADFRVKSPVDDKK